ncbi:MAG: CARDB domain-containing protein [Candidatus Omnitrophota bacterium]
MLRKILLSLFMLFIFMGVTFAQELRVNNKLVQEGDNLNLFFDDLDAGRIVFSIASEDYKKAEITLDKGRTWLPMQEERGYFVYGYHPLSNEVFFPEMLLTDKDKGVQIFRPNLRINYQKEKPDAQLIQLLEKFKTFYENENSDRFLSLFASRYPNLVKFDQAIQNDFYNYKNIRLFYRIDTRAFDDDLEGAIWNVYWQRNYQDRNGNDLTETSANIAMRFDKEGGSWLITGLRNNTIFGSSLLVAQPVVQPISLVNGGAGALPPTVIATIKNNGTVSASNIQVKIYSNSVLFHTDNISSLAAGEQTTVSKQGYYNGYGSSPTGKVIVEQVNGVQTNNEYSATLL